jgi:hypothetical protein
MSRTRERGTVTVIIPTVGRRDLARALRSVRAQSVIPDRVLVVDDSTGGLDSAGALDSAGVPDSAGVRDSAGGLSGPLDDLAAEVVRTSGGCGAAAARNLGMSVSGTDYFAFLDDDDEWLPDHLLDALNALDRDPALDVYACAARVLEGETARVQPAIPYQGGGIENHFFGRDVWRGRSRRIVTPGLVARRWANTVQMDETLAAREDTWWLLSLESAGAVIRQFPEVGVVVHAAKERTDGRVHDQSSVDWAQRLNTHFPGRGADFLVGVVAREKCRKGDPQGVIETWRLRREVGGMTLRHGLLTSLEIVLACSLLVVRRVSSRRAPSSPRGDGS